MFYRLRLLLEGALAYNKTMADKYFAEQLTGDSEGVLGIERAGECGHDRGSIKKMPQIAQKNKRWYLFCEICGKTMDLNFS